MAYFAAKMHRIRFPRPSWGSLQRSTDPLAGFQGPTSKEKEGRGEDTGDGKEGNGGVSGLLLRHEEEENGK